MSLKKMDYIIYTPQVLYTLVAAIYCSFLANMVTQKSILLKSKNLPFQFCIANSTMYGKFNLIRKCFTHENVKKLPSKKDTLAKLQKFLVLPLQPNLYPN